MNVANTRCMHRTRCKHATGKMKHPTFLIETQIPRQKYSHVPAAASATVPGIPHDGLDLSCHQHISGQRAGVALVREGYRGTDEVVLAMSLDALPLGARCPRRLCQPYSAKHQ